MNRQHFLIALSAAQLTQRKWAASIGISQPYLNLILCGKRRAPDYLIHAMNRFVSEQFLRLGITGNIKKNCSNNIRKKNTISKLKQEVA